MRWLCAAVIAGAGCYAPSPINGLPCSSGGDCPAGQSCDLDRQLCSPLPIDAALLDSPADAFVVDPGPAWSAPQPVTAVNTASYETDPAISPDGLELFFSSDRPGTVGGLDIYRATRATTADPFGAPSSVLELQTVLDDFAVEIARDGRTIYFRRNNDIYRATRGSVGAPFGAITRDAQLSTSEIDSNPTLSGDLRVASTTHEIDATNKELVLFSRMNANSPWSPPRTLTELATPMTESGSVLDEKGLAMMFHSNRPGSLGATDIYFTARPSTSAMFLSPVPVTELNTVAIESDPSLDAAWRILVIERERDLYIATR